METIKSVLSSQISDPELVDKLYSKLTTIFDDAQTQAQDDFSTELATIQQAVPQVVDHDSYTHAGVIVETVIKPYIAKVKLWFKGTEDKPGPKTLAFRSHRELCSREKKLLGPAEKLKTQIDNSRRTWYRADKERQRKERAQREKDIQQLHGTRLEQKKQKQIESLDEKMARYGELLANGEGMSAEAQTLLSDISSSVQAQIAYPSSDEVLVPGPVLPELKLTKPQDGVSDIRETYRLKQGEPILQNRLKPEFLIAIPDTSAIVRLIKAHGMEAVSMVSKDPEKPAIVVEEWETFASKKRKRA